MKIDSKFLSPFCSCFFILFFLDMYCVILFYFILFHSIYNSTYSQGGGCNCSRANLAGALMGAHFGFEYPTQHSSVENKENMISRTAEDDSDQIIVSGIPMEWMKKTDKISEILFMAIDRVACVE